MRYITLWNDNVSPWRGLIDRMFDQTFEDTAGFHPASDVEETNTHYVMSVDLPGVAKKDINIEVKDNQLYISGERKSEKRERGFSERYYGKFHRTFTLPTEVEVDKIEAHYQDGVLTVALPKAESVKPRQIKIGDGKSSLFGRLVGGTKETEKEVKAA